MKTVDELQGALSSLRHECDILDQIFADFTAEEIHKERIEALLGAVKATRLKVQMWGASEPKRRTEFTSYDARLADQEGRLINFRKRAKWMRY